MNRLDGHVGHVIWTVFPQHMEALYEILLQMAQWLLKRCLKCHSIRVLGQRSSNDLSLSLTNLHILINIMLITTFRPKSSKLPMKSYVLAFSNI